MERHADGTAGGDENRQPTVEEERHEEGSTSEDDLAQDLAENEELVDQEPGSAAPGDAA